MRIYEMTATFGKLDHETLTLQPGLNIIEAPNEWGKSTWCAFLAAMFYGLDTRAKTTKTALADKEHYAPWSGQPMSGRIRLQWEGRDITIERSTKGRVPLGEFSAYETESGLQIPQLNAGNCGEMLLGAEQSVFRRAGFVRLSDLPVSRDDALLRRLNALVTTGDESGDGERLARELKTLKNKCRYNKSGLLPEAEGELQKLQADVQELKNLQSRCRVLSEQLEQSDQELKKLQNHMQHLKNQEASADAARVREGELSLADAEERVRELEKICRDLPSQEELKGRIEALQKLSLEFDRMLKAGENPGKPTPPEAPAAFCDMDPDAAIEMVQGDQKQYDFLRLNFMLVWILMAVCCGAGAVLCFALRHIAPGILLIAAGVGLMAWGFLSGQLQKEKRKKLTDKYGSEDPAQWLLSAQHYRKAVRMYEQGLGTGKGQSFGLQMEDLQKQQAALCGEKPLGKVMEAMQKNLSDWEKLLQAKKEVEQAQKHLQTLKAMARTSQMSESGDELYLSREETEQRIGEIQNRHKMLLSQIGQYQGRMEALGTENMLFQKKQALEERIRKLKLYYEAATIALAKLEEAASELQRKFSPRITRRAQELMWRMTGGRYEKLTLGEDFSVKTAADEENVLHGALWRSEGTMDQLYLALRLAVSEALMPEAPLVLDDALVRFDGKRLQKTLEILSEEEKQILLFTCQDREGSLYPQALTKKY